jgi:hypothetical protein
MPPYLLLPAVLAVLLLLLALKLRGPGGGRDLLRPPRPEPFTETEAVRLTELIVRGEEAEALRLMRRAGHDEASARKLIGLVTRINGAAAEAREGEV